MSISIAADPLARREDDRPLDDVPQLADVARPVIGLERGHRVGRRRCGVGTPLLGGVARGEMADELGNVLAPLGERRQVHRNDVQPVIEILAEPAGGDLLGKIREVEETTRMSTLTMRWPPTRVKLWSVSTRRILRLGRASACRRSRRGTGCRHGPVRAGRAGRARRPSSTPNNSSSTRSGVIRAALTTMNGALARWLQLWSSRAATSLPTPAGPGDQHAAAGRRRRASASRGRR